MLMSITKSLREQGPGSAQGLAQRLDMDLTALQPMLDLLEAHDRIRALDLSCRRSCAGCTDACGGREQVKIYEAV